MAEAQVRLNRIFDSLKRSKSPFYGAERIVTRPVDKGIVSLYNLTTSAFNNLGKSAAQDILNTLGISGARKNLKSTSTKSERNFTDRSTRSKTTIINNNTTTVASTDDKNQRKLLDRVRLEITRNRKILVNINNNMEKLLKLFKRQSVLARLDMGAESEIVKNAGLSRKKLESNRFGFGLRSLLRGGLMAGLAGGGLAGTLFGIMSSSFKKLFKKIFSLKNLKNILKFGGPLALVSSLAISVYDGFKGAYDSFMNGESAKEIVDNFSQKFLESITFGFLDKEAYENLKDKISNFASKIANAIYKEEDGKAFLFGQQLPTREDLAERVPKIVDNVVNSLANVVTGFISSARNRVSSILNIPPKEEREERSKELLDQVKLYEINQERRRKGKDPLSLEEFQRMRERNSQEKNNRGPYRRRTSPSPHSPYRSSVAIPMLKSRLEGSLRVNREQNEDNEGVQNRRRSSNLQSIKNKFDEIAEKLKNQYGTIINENGNVSWTSERQNMPTRGRSRGIDMVERNSLINEAKSLLDKMNNSKKIEIGTPNVVERKKGGSVVPSIPYLVGERGREIFVPNQSGTVINNNITERLIGSSSDSQRLSSISDSSKPANAVVYNDNRVTNNMTGGGSQGASSGSGKSTYSPFNSLASRLSTRADRTLAPLGYTARTLA